MNGIQLDAMQEQNIREVILPTHESSVITSLNISIIEIETAIKDQQCI